jgi:Ca2+-transporting ATPase
MTAKELSWPEHSEHDVLTRLKTDKHRGLAQNEAIRRLEEYGQNRIAQQSKLSALQIFISQFKSAMIYILMIAVVISFVLGNHADAWVILAAVIVNVIVGFFQEYRAERALTALQHIVTIMAHVVRDGSQQAMPIENLVPGDIIVLEAGARVPADIRLLSATEFAVNESALTGESFPIQKTVEALRSAVIIAEKTNMAFFGTTVISGSAVGVVVATGRHTELGKIASMIAETTREETPLQAKLRSLSKTLALVALTLSFLLFGIGIALQYDFVEMFTTAVALAVAAIPEGLVVVMTVILTLGMQRILKRKALVRKLVAAETLGSATVICTDKTGTLTQGEMHVVQVITHHHDINVHTPTTEKHPDEVFRVLRHALLASDAYLENPKDAMHAWRIFGSPTERAIVGAAAKFQILKESEEHQMPRLASVPFSSDRKYMLTLHRGIGASILFYKGAPEILLRAAHFIDEDGKINQLSHDERQRLQREYQHLSSQGFRTLGVGYIRLPQETTTIEGDPIASGKMIFEGFLCLQDPLRDDAKATIQKTHEAGIRTVMLTGDHHLTAQAIAKEIGLRFESQHVMEGSELERLTQEQLNERITDIDVFARVSPKDKLRIIDAWQRKGAVVAMTGDGVNDAPALKSANIGISLGSATDVAKETADIILLDNNFSVIVNAVEEGRVIFSNLKKVILYLVSDSFTEMILISIAIIFGLPLPLLASQILWVNLISDGLPSLALTMETKENDVMHEKPVARNMPIFSKGMRRTILAISLFTGIGSFIMFYVYWKITGDIDRARTITFLAVSLDSLVYAYSVRTFHTAFWRQNIFSNIWLIVAVVIAFTVQMLVIYTPFMAKILHATAPRAIDWCVVILFTFLGTTILEFMKGSFSRREKRLLI